MYPARQIHKYRDKLRESKCTLQVIKLHIKLTLLISYPRVIKIYEICGPRISNI